MTKKKIYDVLPQLQLERLVKVAKGVGMPITRMMMWQTHKTSSDVPRN